MIGYNSHEKRGEYRRLIPGVEVGIRWNQFEEQVPIDITGFKLDKVAQGTRVRVVDFALPEEAAELQSLWSKRLKRLKDMYRPKTAAKAVTRKTAATKAAPKKLTTQKTASRKTAKRRTTTGAKRAGVRKTRKT